MPTLEGGLNLIMVRANEAAEYDEYRFGMAVRFP